MKHEFKIQKKFNPDLKMEDLENRFKAMHNAKNKLLEVTGLLTDVTAEDDGTFGIDMFLTEKQSTLFIGNLDEILQDTLAELSNTVEQTSETLNNITGGLTGTVTGTLKNTTGELTGTVTDTLGGLTGDLGGLLGRKKRNALFFEENFAAKWDPNVAIPYTFDANVGRG